MNTASVIPQLVKMLDNLDGWLQKGVASAEARGFSADVLAGSRLAPDMFPLARQVQSACDAAKFLAARLSGKEAPAHPDTETTMAELRERVAKARAFVASVTAEDLAGASERVVPLGFLPGKGMVGDDYLLELGLPNFYFHVTTAYAILRHNGVAVGKQDYLGSITLRDL